MSQTTENDAHRFLQEARLSELNRKIAPMWRMPVWLEWAGIVLCIVAFWAVGIGIVLWVLSSLCSSLPRQALAAESTSLEPMEEVYREDRPMPSGSGGSAQEHDAQVKALRRECVERGGVGVYVTFNYRDRLIHVVCLRPPLNTPKHGA